MSLLTPLETQIVTQLAHALVGAGVPVTALRVFGSRARGHSNEHSDLDFGRRPRQPARPQPVPAGAGPWPRPLDRGNGQRLRVQAVPFFSGEESGPLARTIAAEARTVWTRT